MMLMWCARHTGASALVVHGLLSTSPQQNLKEEKPMLVFKTGKVANDKRDLSDPRNIIKFDTVPFINENGEQINTPEVGFAREGESEMTEWMKANNYDGTYLISIQHDTSDLTEDMLVKAQKGKDLITSEGFMLDLQLVNESKSTEGHPVYFTQKHMMPFGQTPAGSRICKTLFAPVPFAKKFFEWAGCGKDNMKLIVERKEMLKLLQQFLLTNSSSARWNESFREEVRKFMTEPKINRTIVMKDLKLDHGDKDVTLIKGKNVTSAVVKVSEKDSDGLIIYIIHDKNSAIKSLAESVSSALNDFTMFIKVETVPFAAVAVLLYSVIAGFV